jgi:transcriptional regulator with XRE-family HTH domain
MPSKSELETKLTAQQRKAAFLLVENELKPTAEKLKQEEIAELVGVTRQGLYKWRTENRNFIAFKNEIADDFLSDKRAEVYAQLLKLITGSQPSVKAIDLFMRRFGLLTERQVTETVDASQQRSADEIKRQLDDLDDLLRED